MREPVPGDVYERWRSHPASFGHARKAWGWHRATRASFRGPYWEPSLPKRNYGYEKRQKELNKQRKKEEKRQRKLDRAKAGPDEEPAAEPASLDPPSQG